MLLLSAWAKVEDEDRSFQTKLRAARDGLAVDLSYLSMAVQDFKEIRDFKDMVGAGLFCTFKRLLEHHLLLRAVKRGGPTSGLQGSGR